MHCVKVNTPTKRVLRNKNYKTMRTSKINIGAKVFNKKNQEGTITKIITKSTGYVEVTYLNGILSEKQAYYLAKFMVENNI